MIRICLPSKRHLLKQLNFLFSMKKTHKHQITRFRNLWLKTVKKKAPNWVNLAFKKTLTCYLSSETQIRKSSTFLHFLTIHKKENPFRKTAGKQISIPEITNKTKRETLCILDNPSVLPWNFHLHLSKQTHFCYENQQWVDLQCP